MIEGNINLKHFDDFHSKLDYQTHPNPKSGFDIIDNDSKGRYNSTFTTVQVGRNVPTSITKYLFDMFDLKSISFSVQRMLPGMILPYHSDKFGFYLAQNPGIQINQIKRVIIFLEDWKAGHISEIDGESHVNWKKGDWISWVGSTPHLAANLGFENRYTLQITGILK